MATKTFITDIRQLIANDEIPTAIKKLQVFLKNSPNLNEVLLQSARHADILKQIRLGIVDFDNANITQNKIRLGLLDLLTEVEAQEFQPAIQKEMEKAISIVNSKNVVVGNIDAGGDVNIGDRNIHTESKTSKNLRLFLFLFVPILVIGGTYFWYQSAMKQPFSLNVLIGNQTPNSKLSEPLAGLILSYGGVSHPEEQGKMTTVFQNIPYTFKTKTFRLQYEAKGFVKIDTTFKYTSFVTIPVRRNDDLAILQGYVYEDGTASDEGIEGVKVSIACCSTFTDVSGKFSLKIPFEFQLEDQQVELYKKGYLQKSTEESIFKDTNISTYLEKKDR